MPKVKTITLDGTEIAVKFEKGYPYYVITNMGDGELYASGNPGITAYADGVYTILSGTEIRISPELSADTVFLLGSGMVQVRAEEIAVPTSFRAVPKGGGSGGVTDYSLLENKPSIDGNVLNGNKTLADLGVTNFDRQYASLSNKPIIYSDTLEIGITGVKNWYRAFTVSKNDMLFSAIISIQASAFVTNNVTGTTLIALLSFCDREASVGTDISLKILSSSGDRSIIPKIRVVYPANRTFEHGVHIDFYGSPPGIMSYNASIIIDPAVKGLNAVTAKIATAPNVLGTQNAKIFDNVSAIDPITVDSALSETSENPVQNKVVAAAINELSQRISQLESKE